MKRNSRKEHKKLLSHNQQQLNAFLLKESQQSEYNDELIKEIFSEKKNESRSIMNTAEELEKEALHQAELTETKSLLKEIEEKMNERKKTVEETNSAIEQLEKEVTLRIVQQKKDLEELNKAVGSSYLDWFSEKLNFFPFKKKLSLFLGIIVFLPIILFSFFLIRTFKKMFSALNF